MAKLFLILSVCFVALTAGQKLISAFQNGIAESNDVIYRDIEYDNSNNSNEVSNELGTIEVKVVSLDQTEKQKDPGQVLNYTVGRRVAGDRLVAHSAQSYHYSTYRDLELTLSYPSTGVGAIVTYVQIIVDQSSNIGRAYVVSGGIGQRRIMIKLESRHTDHLSYTVSVYGI